MALEDQHEFNSSDLSCFLQDVHTKSGLMCNVLTGSCVRTNAVVFGETAETSGGKVQLAKDRL